ncbi:hypothetical protein ACFL5O_11130 [Myxococcota bacterium]
MKRRKVWLIGSSAIVMALATGYAVGRAKAAAVPTTAAMTYQGVLTDANNAPLTGSKNLQLTLWDAAEDGSLKCTVGPAPQQLAAGAFRVALPDDCTAAVRTVPNLWAEVFVDGTSMGRSKLGTVPYAVEANHATSATTAQTAQAAMALVDAPVKAGLSHYLVTQANLATSDICKNTTGSTVDCSCPEGFYVVAGGGWGATGTSLRESSPRGVNEWRIVCTSGTADTLCNGFRITCSRIAP